MVHACVELSCAHQGLASLLDAATKNKLFESAARTTLEMSPTTLEQDLVVLAGLEADSESSVDNERKVLAAAVGAGLAGEAALVWALEKLHRQRLIEAVRTRHC